MCFTVSDEIDLVLPLLLLQSVFGAAMVTHAAAAQNENNRPHQPKPCKDRKISTVTFNFQWDSYKILHLLAVM